MKGKFFENLSEILNRSCYINKFQSIQMIAKIIHTALLCGFFMCITVHIRPFSDAQHWQELCWVSAGNSAYRDSIEGNWSERYPLWFWFLSCQGFRRKPGRYGQCTQYKVGFDFVILSLSYVDALRLASGFVLKHKHSLFVQIYLNT